MIIILAALLCCAIIKCILHFDGNHKHLQRDLLKGLSELYVRQMMAGNSFGKQKLQNTLFLNLPKWYQ
jgi:hypothetical protein